MQVLKVVSCLAGSDAQRVLQPGDLLLAVNGTPVTSFPALEALLEAAPPAAAVAPAPADSQLPQQVGPSQLRATSLCASSTTFPVMRELFQRLWHGMQS